jgi:hypothetical protein
LLKTMGYLIGRVSNLKSDNALRITLFNFLTTTC